MTVSWPSKDPDEILDFSLDWSERLEGDTISAATWGTSDPVGLTRTSQQVSGGVTSAFFSGGAEGTTYSITVTIDTAGGRRMQETAKLKIKSR